MKRRSDAVDVRIAFASRHVVAGQHDDLRTIEIAGQVAADDACCFGKDLRADVGGAKFLRMRG